MNQIEVAGLSHRKPEFMSVEFAVDKMTLGQEFLPVLPYQYYSTVVLHTHISPGDEK
jgi:hypothetical protein